MAKKTRFVRVDVVANGKAGGKARAKKLTPKRRREIAREGAAARWPK
jgi:hypothetical protein